MKHGFALLTAGFLALTTSATAAPTSSDSEGRAGVTDTQLSLARLAHLEQEMAGGGPEDGNVITAGRGKKGFFIKDTDGNFQLNIGGRTQIRYTYKGRDKRGNSGFSTTDQSYLEIERMRLKLTGHVLDPSLKYYFQWDGDTDKGGAFTTVDAFVQYVYSDMAKIGVGQYKAHFLRQEKTSSGKQQLVERSLANEFFNIDRVLGIWLEGEMATEEEGPNIFYAFAVTNGFRSLNRGVGSDQVPGVVGKLDFNLMGDYGYSEGDIKVSDEPSLVVGLSGAFDANNGTGASAAQYKVYQAGTDLGFKSGGFSLQAEYMMRWLDYETTAGATDPDVAGGRSVFSHGWYAQAGFMILPEQGIELAGRAGAVYGNEGANDGIATEFGPGINWYINGHNVKLQTDVMFFDIPADMPRQSSRLDRSGPTAPPGSGFSSPGYVEG